ncbi:hypothetical protein Zmor_005254 [Zophobas morio]|uniref:Uncharacterized protein n=1 Tax=Zophobas morio TaxID=2755281 RepID=A0AA38IN00_9CUCU|nr:hypothetical protein Zmor_005254 [Zophobas morio]
MWLSFLLIPQTSRLKLTCEKKLKSTSAVWGSWLWLFSPHDGDSTLSASTYHSGPLYHEDTCHATRYCNKTRASRHPDRSPDLYSRPVSFVQMARSPARQGTAHFASATCSCVIYHSFI